MTKRKARGHSAVMASRSEPPDSLDFFPTPPWATRALCEHLLGRPAGLDVRSDKTCWDPCAGQGHMAEVLREYFQTVHASDVFPYRPDYALGSFVGQPDGLLDDIARCPFRPDWIVMNPPFNQAEAFVLRALAEARRGVAMFIRTAWLESTGRYETIFSKHQPAVVGQFCERVALTKGEWKPDASTATAYLWIVWDKKSHDHETRMIWIPPGQKERHTKRSDVEKFSGQRRDEPLLGVL